MSDQDLAIKKGFMHRLEKIDFRILVWALFIITVVIRLFYFFQTYSQPVWWDEGDYMNLARAWAFGKPGWDLNPLRPVLFPLIVAVLMKVGFSELLFRIISILFSLLAIFITYKLGKSMYNKYVGIFAATMLAFFWSFLFFTFRLLVDIPVASLWLLSLYLFWQGHENNSKRHLIFLGPAIALTFLMKFTGALVALAILIYLLATEGFRWLKNKTLWKTAAFGFTIALPYFIFQWAKFGSPFAFYTRAIGMMAPNPRSFFRTLMDYILQIIPLMHIVYLVLFIIGFIIALRIFFCLDLLRTNKHKELRADLLTMLSFMIPMLYLIYIGYGLYIEERYSFLSYPLMFILAGNALCFIYLKAAKIHKIIGIILVVLLLGFGSYQNLVHANSAIKEKVNSFIQVKEAGKLIQESGSADDVVVSFHTQAELQYHANRRVMGIAGKNETELRDILKKDKVSFYVANIFVQPNPESIWKVAFPYQHPEIFTIIGAYEPYIDQEKKIPILAVFKVNQTAL